MKCPLYLFVVDLKKIFQFFSMESSSIQIIFNDDHIKNTFKRTETNQLANFLACCGGLLGLFMGLSVLSVIELIYFTLLRLGFAIYRRKCNGMVEPSKRADSNSASNDGPK